MELLELLNGSQWERCNRPEAPNDFKWKLHNSQFVVNVGFKREVPETYFTS